MKKIGALVLTGILGFASSLAVRAAPILIDFESTAGTTQAGFTRISDNNVNTIGGFDFQTTGTLFDRTPGFTNGGAFTYEDLLDDFAYTNAGGGATTAPIITLAITQLAANTPYDIRVWTGDQFGCGNPWACLITTMITTIDGTGGPFGSSFDSATNPTTNDQYSSLASITSDAAGAITLEIQGVSNDNLQAYTRLNGLSLNLSPPGTAGDIPAPGTLALLGLGLLGLARRSRRRAV